MVVRNVWAGGMEQIRLEEQRGAGFHLHIDFFKKRGNLLDLGRVRSGLVPYFAMLQSSQEV